jgi:hypothetical protein
MPGFAHFGRTRKPLAVVVGIVFLFIVAWIVVARLVAGDREESFYPSLAEANKNGAITRGWIPDEFLPRSSRDIHEIHDLSPSTEWCAFEVVPTDSQKLLRNLKHLDVLPASMRHVPSPGVSWWPSVLVGNLDAEAIHKAGFDLYIVEMPATSVTTTVWLFAIDWSEGRGFFYSR